MEMYSTGFLLSYIASRRGPIPVAVVAS